MGDMEKIINQAKSRMQDMLSSVQDYNSYFLKTKEDSELLSRILFSMSAIDRRFFVDIPGYEYNDNALSIGEGQTISQPSTVARMLLLAELKQGDLVLEVGAGSGWNASIISLLTYPGYVVSIDRINSLVEKARANFSRLKKNLNINMPHISSKLKVDFFCQDIFKVEGMFDKIIVTAGILDDQEEKIRYLARKLLKKNGILICPRASGRMIIFKKDRILRKEETKEEYVFVPLLEGLR